MFELGDIIKGKENDYYGVTNENMYKGKVIDTQGNYMEIRILEHRICCYAGDVFTVKNSKEYFEYYKEYPYFLIEYG
ncbi:MAG: hypothetical protein ACOC22_02885 [bacterium]